MPHARVASHDRDEWRRNYLYVKPVCDVLEERDMSLRIIFKQYCKLKAASTRKSARMHMDDWLQLCSEASLIDDTIPTREAIQAFLYARMRPSDELKHATLNSSITVTDFFEALCRVAELKWLPSDDVLQEEAGIWDGDVHRFFAEGFAHTHIARLARKWNATKHTVTAAISLASTVAPFSIERHGDERHGPSKAERAVSAEAGKWEATGEGSSAAGEQLDDDDSEDLARMPLHERLEKLLQLLHGNLSDFRRREDAKPGGAGMRQ